MQDGGRGDRLGDTGDPKKGGGSHRLFLLDVGVTEAASVHQLAVARDGQGGAGDLALLQEGGHQVVEARQPWIGGAGDGNRVAVRLLREGVRRGAEAKCHGGATKEAASGREERLSGV